MTKHQHSENTAEPAVRSSTLRRAPLGGGNSNMAPPPGGSSKAASGGTLEAAPAGSSAAASTGTRASDSQRLDKIVEGARCAIYFDEDEVDEDFFGRKVGGWFLGIIVAVQRSKKTATVKLDDNSLVLGVAFQDVRPVRRGATLEDAHLLYCRNREGTEEIVVADTNPEKLKVGDSVLACFNDGKLPDDPDAWYRGRVAEIGQSDDGTPICAVAYDDKDYESGIPLRSNVVTLLERGFENPGWLEGLVVHIPSKRHKDECAFGVIQAPRPNQPIQILYTKENGQSVVEKRPYNVVVQKLLEEAKKDATFHTFPVHQFGLVDSNLPPPTKKQKRAPVTKKPAPAAAAARKPRAQTKKSKPTAAATAHMKLEEDDGNGPAEDKKPAARKPTARSRMAAAKKPDVALEDDEDVTAVAETFWRLELDPPLPEPERPLRPMDNSLAKAFGDALNSCSAEQGHEWLSFLASMHGRVPNDNLWRLVLDLNAFGPRGRVIFPNSFKMTLCSDYLRQIFAKKGMLEACCEHIDTHFKSGHDGVSYADTFFQQMLSVYYNAENDETRYTKPAAERMVETLHAKVCFAENFTTLLQHSLKPFVVADRNSSKRRAQQDDTYRTLPIVRDIVQARRGSKDALEQSVRAFAELYLKSGQFLTDGPLQPYLDNEVTRETLNLANGAVQRLTDLLGTVISYMAWLYSQEANESVGALADIISNLIRLAIENDTFDKEPLLGDIMTMEKFRVKMKLRLILMIKKEIVPQLRPRLSERLDVAKLYNFLYDD